MSLDNVLAVAGAARDHPGILIIGLLLSVALMGIAANLIAKYIERYRWIAYIGLAVILMLKASGVKNVVASDFSAGSAAAAYARQRIAALSGGAPQ